MNKHASAIIIWGFIAAFLVFGGCRTASPGGQNPEEDFMAFSRSDPSRARTMMRDSMDLAALCRSDRGQECLSAWIGLYQAADSATSDAQHVLLRMKDDSVYLVRRAVNGICRAMTEKGWIDHACQVAAFPYGIDPRQHPQIAARLLTATLLLGRPAPPIEGLRPAAKIPSACVVIFYESRCRTCLAMLSELEVNYAALKQAGIRVVALSTDTDRELFASIADRFPWPDTLCDTQGYESINMLRWGVAATPTIFVLGQDGIVRGQYDSIDEVWELLVYRLKILNRSDLTKMVTRSPQPV